MYCPIPTAHCMPGLLACCEVNEFVELALGCLGSGNILVAQNVDELFKKKTNGTSERKF